MFGLAAQPCTKPFAAAHTSPIHLPSGSAAAGWGRSSRSSPPLPAAPPACRITPNTAHHSKLSKHFSMLKEASCSPLRRRRCSSMWSASSCAPACTRNTIAAWPRKAVYTTGLYSTVTPLLHMASSTVMGRRALPATFGIMVP